MILQENAVAKEERGITYPLVSLRTHLGNYDCGKDKRKKQEETGKAEEATRKIRVGGEEKKGWFGAGF